MKPKERVIAAGEFKAKCLAVLDEVAKQGHSVVVTKRGRPVARLVPIAETRKSLIGSVIEEGDIVSAIGESWDAQT
jgi:prevent-host-death family protein